MTIIFFLDKLISHINRIIQCCPVSSPIPWGQIQQSRKSRCQMISYPLTQVGRLLVYLTVWDSTMSQYSKLYSHTLTYCFWLSITFIFYRKRWSLEDLLTCFPWWNLECHMLYSDDISSTQPSIQECLIFTLEQGLRK